MGFKLSKWDEKLIKFAGLFEEHMMDLNKNIPLEEALDRGWKIMADCFQAKEISIKKELMDKYTALENEYHFIFKILSRSDDFEFRPGFAERAKRYRYPAILFKMYDDKDYSGLIWKSIRPEFSKL